MFEDLIKRLRNRRICIQQSGSLDDFPLLKEAADAIENLTKIVSDLSYDETCDPEYRQTHRVGG